MKPIIFIVVSLFYILFASFYIRHQSRRIRTITQLIASFSDYNYQRRFEYRGYDELSLLAATLEQYRLDRIATIAESERSEEENRELIRNIAHDLRTPLTALIGYLEIMQKDEAELPDQHVAYLDSAKTKAEQLRTISNDVFEHFLIKSDQIKGMLVLMNGQLFMAQIADLMETDLEALGFTLQTDLTPEPYMLRINTEMFDRILNNLLNNIARYGDRDTPCQLSTSLLTTESADDRSVQTSAPSAMSSAGDTVAVTPSPVAVASAAASVVVVVVSVVSAESVPPHAASSAVRARAETVADLRASFMKLFSSGE